MKEVKKEVIFTPAGYPELATINCILQLVENEEFDKDAILRMLTYLQDYIQDTY